MEGGLDFIQAQARMRDQIGRAWAIPQYLMEPDPPQWGNRITAAEAELAFFPRYATAYVECWLAMERIVYRVVLPWRRQRDDEECAQCSGR